MDALDFSAMCYNKMRGQKWREVHIAIKHYMAPLPYWQLVARKSSLINRNGEAQLGLMDLQILFLWDVNLWKIFTLWLWRCWVKKSVDQRIIERNVSIPPSWSRSSNRSTHAHISHFPPPPHVLHEGRCVKCKCCWKNSTNNCWYVVLRISRLDLEYQTKIN